MSADIDFSWHYESLQLITKIILLFQSEFAFLRSSWFYKLCSNAACAIQYLVSLGN